MAEELDLTAEQRGKIREITAKYMGGALGDRMDAMREARQKLQAVIHDPLATDEQVEQAAKAISSEAVAIAVERHRMAGEISAVLTPEQRQKAAELRQSAREKRAGRRGAGPRGGVPDWF
jgi:Spy/CpxP family protein refolding chaperone